MADAGFTCAGTVKRGLVRRQSDWLQIPRVPMNQTLGSGLYFKAQASHALEVYERLRGRPLGSLEY